eukprot:jgi/Chlat1/3938/Chrsp26S04195
MVFEGHEAPLVPTEWRGDDDSMPLTPSSSAASTPNRLLRTPSSGGLYRSPSSSNVARLLIAAQKPTQMKVILLALIVATASVLAYVLRLNAGAFICLEGSVKCPYSQQLATAQDWRSYGVQQRLNSQPRRSVIQTARAKRSIHMKTSARLVPWDAAIVKGKPELRARDPAICGSWMLAYAEMHRKAMAIINDPNASEAEKKKLKFVVFRCRQYGKYDDQCGGLADRFAGLISTFLFALLTDRIFLMDWRGAEVAFRSPYINWTYTDAIVGGPEADAELPPMPSVSISPQWGNNVTTKDGEIGLFNWHDCEVRRRTWNCGGAFGGKLGNLTTAFPQRVIVVGFNRGVVSMAYREQNEVARRLKDLGMKPQFAFGCLLHMLVRPTKLLRTQFAQHAAVLEDPDSFAVGIHIRTGDSSFSADKKITCADFDGHGTQFYDYMRSAEDLQAVKGLGKKVVWFLMTDSETLKGDIRMRYGNKVMTTDVAPAHIDKEVYATAKYNTPEKNLIGALGEWWLFSKCDYFVMKRGSGFSRTALAYSLHEAAAIYPGNGPYFFMQTYELSEHGAGL